MKNNKFNKTFSGTFMLVVLILLILFDVFDWPLKYLLYVLLIGMLIFIIMSIPLMDYIMKKYYYVSYDFEVPDYLKEFIQRICDNNDMKFPKIGFIKDGAPNSCTYGVTKNNARIVLTQGIFDKLNQDEIEAIVAHEIGHAVHYNMFFMTVIQVIPSILYCMYDANNNSCSSDENYSSFLGDVAYFLYVFCSFFVFIFSRLREYHADKFSINATKNPNALASALVKVGYGLTVSDDEINDDSDDFREKFLRYVKKMRALNFPSFGIFDVKTSKTFVVTSYENGKISNDNIKKAACWELCSPWSKWYELYSSHPLISKRLKAICKYCNMYGQEEFISFDDKKPESFVGKFILELLIKFLPLITFILLLFIGIFFVDNISNIMVYIGLSLMIFTFSLFVPFRFIYKNHDYKENTVRNLFSELNVSGINSVPCIIKGKIIGRGTPECILLDDFVLQDDTGIMLLNYSHPLGGINSLFNVKLKDYINKDVVIKGWYRRSPVPYVEIYTLETDNKFKKCYSYGFTLGLLIFMLCIGVFIMALGVVL